MDRKQLSSVRSVLLGLEQKGLRARITEHGSETVVMNAEELDAIDEAVKLLDPEVHPAAWHLQEELDAHD